MVLVLQIFVVSRVFLGSHVALGVQHYAALNLVLVMAIVREHKKALPAVT